MFSIGKILIYVGLSIAIVGILFLIFPLGKLPGDIKIDKEKVKIYFPIVSSIIISIILTIGINLLIWLFRK